MTTATNKSPRIFDCFCFFRELEVLEIRLNELSETVERFVLVESVWDFAGNPKPLYFEENKDLFSPFLDRIEHIVVHDRPKDEAERFAFQHLQRDHMVRGLADAAPRDLVLISDVDEIPRAPVLEAARRLLSERDMFLIFLMQHHALRLNLIKPGMTIVGSRMVRRSRLRHPHLVRRLKKAYWKSMPDWLDQIPARYNSLVATGRPIPRHILQDAGWHLNSMGNADLMGAKWNAFNRDERGMDEISWAESIGAILDDGSDIAGEMGLDHVALSQLPATIANNPDRYAHLIDRPPGA